MPEVFDDLFTEEDRMLDKALSELLSADNIEMKTEIQQPINLAKLDTIGYVFGAMGYSLSSGTIKHFIDRMNLFFVSHNRLSRSETIEGLRAISGRERQTEGEPIK